MKKITKCPFCEGTQFTITYQMGHGAVVSVSNPLRSQLLYHKICLNCGSVVRSFVKEPKLLISRKKRQELDS